MAAKVTAKRTRTRWSASEVMMILTVLLMALVMPSSLCAALSTSKIARTSTLGPCHSLARCNNFQSMVQKSHNKWTEASTSPLFSSSQNNAEDGSVTSTETRNLKNLGQLTLSGLMAFAYMRYQQLVILASVAYFLVKRVGIEGRKSGVQPVIRDTILVGGIFTALQITQRLLGPVKLIVELLVTAFFSYMFLIIASKQEKV